MGTHPIFESDFDCLTDKKGTDEANEDQAFTYDESNRTSMGFVFLFAPGIILLFSLIWLMFDWPAILRELCTKRTVSKEESPEYYTNYRTGSQKAIAIIRQAKV